jgi:Mrp family chromosome partitioning ATPase
LNLLFGADVQIILCHFRSNRRFFTMMATVSLGSRSVLCKRLLSSTTPVSLGMGRSVLCKRLLSSTRLRSLSTAVSEVPAFVLSHPSTVDDPSNNERGRIVCVTSGKGGVGKTTASASFALGLASKGHSTCVVDFDIGLRNLDLHLGMERRVIFDIVNVLLDECSLHQALLKDRREPNLSLLAASQTHDKDVLTVDGVERILTELTESFDYVGMYFLI